MFRLWSRFSGLFERGSSFILGCCPKPECGRLSVLFQAAYLHGIEGAHLTPPELKIKNHFTTWVKTGALRVQNMSTAWVKTGALRG